MDKYRLDYLVAKKLGVSRSSATNLIESGMVSVSGQAKHKTSLKFAEDSLIEIKQAKKAKKQNLELKILYEDKDCVVIDKPAGVLAHSKGAFSEEVTVASWLLPRTKGFGKDNNRAGIVHRLDRGTSGVMICAKTPESLLFLQKQFSTRKVKKIYNALIKDNLSPSEAVIEIPIERNPKDPKRFRAGSNGKSALTTYRTLKKFFVDDTNYNLIELLPATGRTHQLRVHMKYMKHPIIGDDFYGGLKADRLYLHAAKLEITLPSGEKKIFEAPLPRSFIKPKILKNG